MTKSALITGITGQDGSYLAGLLLSKGYTVHGIIRRSSTFNTGRIRHIFQDPQDIDRRLFLYYGDLTSGEQVSHLVHKVQPNEICHLGAQSHVQVSFEAPEYMNQVGARDDSHPGGDPAVGYRDPILQRGQFGDVQQRALAPE